MYSLQVDFLKYASNRFVKEDFPVGRIASKSNSKEFVRAEFCYYGRQKRANNNYGFTFLEVLVALVLSAMLLLCVLRVYLSSKFLYTNIEANVTVQNQLRFLTHYLRHEISMTGYSGCSKFANLDLHNNTAFSFAVANHIRGFSSANLPSALQKYQIAAGTDVLVIQKGDEGASLVTDSVIKAGATSFHAKENPATKYNKFLLLADCRSADLFQANSLGGNLVQTSTPIVHEYNAGATTVSRFTETAYFISSRSNLAKHNHKKTQVGSSSGLYYAVNYGDKEELMDGISNLQIRYGVVNAKTGNITGYFTAAQVDASNLWSEVSSVVLAFTLAAALQGDKIKTWGTYHSQTGFQGKVLRNSSSLALQRGASEASKRSLLNINEHCERGRNKAADQNATPIIDSSSLVLQRGAPEVSKRSLLNINEHCERGSNKAADQNATPIIDSSSLVLQRGAPEVSKRSLLNINEHCERGSNKAVDQNAKSIYVKLRQRT